ncbi:hypothetical protein EYF80_015663 [Liparis tanakae]|uniref:Uncharacterized protein n=1 Tax=Liparis tanakae TaxID=230148 RepID=A0A4Z2I9E3_9TELE|nr:hypothetical protein EYF80_015663 [Liparis tanakae]
MKKNSNPCTTGPACSCSYATRVRSEPPAMQSGGGDEARRVDRGSDQPPVTSAQTGVMGATVVSMGDGRGLVFLVCSAVGAEFAWMGVMGPLVAARYRRTPPILDVVHCSEAWAVKQCSRAPGEEAPLVGQQAGHRQEAGHPHELEEAADRRQVPLPEGGVKGQRRDFLLDGRREERRGVTWPLHSVAVSVPAKYSLPTGSLSTLQTGEEREREESASVRRL